MRRVKRHIDEYIKPVPYYYYDNNGISEGDYKLVPNILKAIMKKRPDLLIDKVEDFIMETYMWCLQTNKDYNPNLFMREVITRYTRWYRKEQGLSTGTGKPLLRGAINIVSADNTDEYSYFEAEDNRWQSAMNDELGEEVF